jgi:predicted N-formylglutamate amidohydrolase
MHPDSFVHIPRRGPTRLILLCDHASNHVPAEYQSLGLPAAEFERHIGYDIGAAALTRLLAETLGASAFLTCFSRLVIDPNRGLDDPTLIMKLSDGAVVPGNARITVQERERRIERFYKPYHAAIAGMIDTMLDQGEVPVLFSIHSFTPVWRGVPRPWHAGILWDRDGRLPLPMLAALKAIAGLCVGDNEPYHGALAGDTLNVHGTQRGLPHVLVEIRQDLIADKSGVDEWAERLAQVLEPIMKEAQLNEVKYFGGL